jgi:hypothetical protein
MVVSQDTIKRLKGFLGLHSTEEVEEWHQFCQDEALGNEAVKSV